jgi:hypothetical protein
MPRDRIACLVLPVAALLCILPLLLQGPSCGHDYDFHLLNWFEAAAQFRHGNLHPQWAISPAFNAGEPRFLFYPPLSWTIGAILGLFLPWTITPVAFIWLTLTTAGLSLYRLARQFTGPSASLLAATLYLANPYMLFTAYERSAYAELLAAAWLPLLFLAILKPRPTIPSIALPLALLWLTNAPAAVMGTYALAILALLRLLLRPKKPQSRPTLALTTAAGTLLGLALAAFYILPAALERKYVQIAMVILPGMRIDDNTLFHHTGLSEEALFHDDVLHTASIVAILLLAATAITLFAARPRPRLTLPLAILTAIIALFLTPISLPLWHHLPELAFLQFSWRLLALQATIFALATALALDRRFPHPVKNSCHSERSEEPPYFAFALPVLSLALAALLTLPAIHFFRQSCDDPDTVPARLALFQSQAGTDPTDEYTPKTADNDTLGEHDPPFWLSPDPDAPPPPGTTPSTAPLDLTVSSPIDQTLILNLREYPDWHTDINSRPAEAPIPRADGLLNLDIPPGTSHIHIHWSASPAEHAADALSTIALVALLYLSKRPDRLTGLIK